MALEPAPAAGNKIANDSRFSHLSRASHRVRHNVRVYEIQRGLHRNTEHSTDHRQAHFLMESRESEARAGRHVHADGVLRLSEPRDLPAAELLELPDHVHYQHTVHRKLAL